MDHILSSIPLGRTSWLLPSVGDAREAVINGLGRCFCGRKSQRRWGNSRVRLLGPRRVSGCAANRQPVSQGAVSVFVPMKMSECALFCAFGARVTDFARFHRWAVLSPVVYLHFLRDVMWNILSYTYLPSVYHLC